MNSTSRNNEGLLILVHQGHSYASELAGLAGELGVEAYLLSSRSSQPGVLDAAVEQAAWSAEIDGSALAERDVADALATLTARGKRVLGCIATMEGYRLLAAGVNSKVGAADSTIPALRNTLDKLAMRRMLCDAGLTRVAACPLDKEALHTALRSGKPAFIKPRRGAASFGAFKLTAAVDYSRITSLQDAMKADCQIACVFYGMYDFIVEDYIEGREYSFESILLDSELFVVASHVKTELEETAQTVLEHCMVSPSLLTLDELRGAREYINAACRALGLTDGCFHIEMRRSPGGWEIIEINPRMGGGLINDSVEVVTGGVSMLELWVRSVLAAALFESHSQLRARLRALDESLAPRANGMASFIRWYFGQPGTLVKKVFVNDTVQPPYRHAVYVREGDKLPASHREIDVGEALWKLDRAELPARLVELAAASRHFLTFEYT